jgi:hypothetical protein
MAQEKRNGKNVNSRIAPSLKAKFTKYCKKQNLSEAEWIRNQIQGVFKKK